jgi:hypothetical protein
VNALKDSTSEVSVMLGISSPAPSSPSAAEEEKKSSGSPLADALFAAADSTPATPCTASAFSSLLFSAADEEDESATAINALNSFNTIEITDHHFRLTFAPEIGKVHAAFSLLTVGSPNAPPPPKKSIESSELKVRTDDGFDSEERSTFFALISRSSRNHNPPTQPFLRGSLRSPHSLRSLQSALLTNPEKMCQNYLNIIPGSPTFDRVYSTLTSRPQSSPITFDDFSSLFIVNYLAYLAFCNLTKCLPESLSSDEVTKMDREEVRMDRI